MNFDHICPQCLIDSPPPRLHVYLLFICLITYWVQLVLPMFVGVSHLQEHGQPNRDLIIKEKLILLRNHQLSIIPHLGWESSWAPLLPMLQCWLAWSCTGLTQDIPGSVSLPRVQPSCRVQKTMFSSSFPQLLTLPIFWFPSFHVGLRLLGVWSAIQMFHLWLNTPLTFIRYSLARGEPLHWPTTHCTET